MVGSKEAEAAADVFSALATKVQLRLRWWINCYLAVLSLKNSSAEINEQDVAPQHHTVGVGGIFRIRMLCQLRDLQDKKEEENTWLALTNHIFNLRLAGIKDM